MDNLNFNLSDFVKSTERQIEQLNDANGVMEFPISVFPPIFKNLINECRESLNFPADYTGTAILTAVATAIGTSAKLKVKTGWYEFPSLYTVIIGNAGANKSHPLSLVFNVFNEIDKKAINKFELLHEEYEEYQKLNRKQKLEETEVKRPKLVKSILSNFTPEVLHQRLSDNLRGCTVVSDELATFLEGMNNYSKGDQSSTYLSFWSNKPTTIDRVNKPIPLFIQEPFVNIIGGLQPRALKKSFTANKTDSGFLQRFLFAFPANAEKYPINDIEMNSSTLNQFNAFLINYINGHQVEIDTNTGKIKSRLYYWSKEAKDYFYEWQKGNTIKVNQYSDELKGEIISKFDIHFVRIALILHVMEDNASSEISLNAVIGAEALCKYFIHNAFKVLDILDTPVIPKETLPLNKLKFYEALQNEFTTSDAISLGEHANFRMNEKFVQRFITDTSYFMRVSQGNYSKIN